MTEWDLQRERDTTTVKQLMWKTSSQTKCGILNINSDSCYKWWRTVNLTSRSCIPPFSVVKWVCIYVSEYVCIPKIQLATCVRFVSLEVNEEKRTLGLNWKLEIHRATYLKANQNILVFNTTAFFYANHTAWNIWFLRPIFLLCQVTESLVGCWILVGKSSWIPSLCWCHYCLVTTTQNSGTKTSIQF